MKHYAWIALLGIAACNSPAAPGGVMLMGSWGGTDGRLTATQVNTVWAGACGSGSTSQPIMLDKHSQFDIAGVYGAAGTAQQPVRFVGKAEPRRIQLRVLRADSSVAVGPIMLDLGQQPALANCH